MWRIGQVEWLICIMGSEKDHLSLIHGMWFLSHREKQFSSIQIQNCPGILRKLLYGGEGMQKNDYLSAFIF